MEPVTHILTGACLSRTGLNRRAAYTTLAMAIAAEFPDIDTLWGWRGPVASFQHHRGITHTFLGIPFEGALIVALLYALHRWRVRRHARALDTKRPLTAAPVRWGLLYAWVIIALLSHLLLDFTNNYGLRPFFPFNPRWYAASITFIFDPLMFLLLGVALVLPFIFRLVSAEVGARRQPFAARGWAVAALLGVVAMWVLRVVEHRNATSLAMAQTLSYTPAAASTAQAAQSAQYGSTQNADAPAPDEPQILLQPQQVLASPDPLSPFRWWTVTDFGPVYQLAKVDTRTSAVVVAQERQPKLPMSPALQAAEASWLGRVYMDWSPMPFLDVTRVTSADSEVDSSDDPVAVGHTLVTFRDPRFTGDIAGMQGRTPLQGTVELDANNRVVRESMSGKTQR